MVSYGTGDDESERGDESADMVTTSKATSKVAMAKGSNATQVIASLHQRRLF